MISSPFEWPLGEGCGLPLLMVPRSSATDASSPLPVLVSTVTETRRNRQATPPVQDSVDAEEAQAVRAEGLDPDDPAVIAAIDISVVMSGATTPDFGAIARR